MDARAIARRLKQWIDSRGLTQKALAKMLRVSENSVSAWLPNKAYPRLAPKTPEAASLLKLAKETNLSLDWLLLERGPPEYVEEKPGGYKERRPADELLREIIARKLKITERVTSTELWAAMPPERETTQLATSAVAHEFRNRLQVHRVDVVPYVFHPRVGECLSELRAISEDVQRQGNEDTAAKIRAISMDLDVLEHSKNRYIRYGAEGVPPVFDGERRITPNLDDEAEGQGPRDFPLGYPPPPTPPASEPYE